MVYEFVGKIWYRSTDGRHTVSSSEYFANIPYEAFMQGLEVPLDRPRVVPNVFATAARQFDGQPRVDPLNPMRRPAFLPSPRGLDGDPIFQDGAAQQGAGVS